MIPRILSFVRLHYKRLSQSALVRNIAVVATGTAGAQIITMACAPVISRLYGPEAYGVLGVFISIVAVLGPISALTYPMAIVLPTADDRASELAKLSLVVGGATSLLTLFVLLAFDNYLADVFNLGGSTLLLYLVPLAMFFAALLQVREQWSIRKKDFSLIAKVGVIQSLGINGSKILVGLLMPMGICLVAITVIGNLAHSIILSVGARNGSKLSLVDSTWHKQALAVAGKQYREFSLFQTPQAFMNALSQSIPVLMLASLFGPASAGYYALAKSVLGIPAGLIGKAVGDVFYPRISEANNAKEYLFPLLIKATLSLAMVGIIPFSTVVLFGPTLFDWVFGEDWDMAGGYAQWIAVWLYTAFVNPPSVKALMVLKKQKSALLINLCTLPLRILGLYVGFYVYASELMAIAFYCIAGVVHNVIFVLYAIAQSRKGL